MAESRLYNSLAAPAWCQAGRFKVYGLTLKPFSFLHSFQLESLDNPLWTGNGTPEQEDVALAAQICASTEIVTDFQAIDFSKFDRLTEIKRWHSYVTMCAARPIPPDYVPDSGGSPLEAPFELCVVSYLIQHTTFKADEVWRMPYGMALWYFESVREQITGRSMIVSEATLAEIEAMSTPEAVAARKAKEEKAKWIIQNVRDPKRRFELLDLLETGALPDNWQEVPNV